MGQDTDALRVTTPDGATIDMTELVEAARVIRRNALQDAEHERDFGIDKMQLGYVTLGMRIAVLHLLGNDAETVFVERLNNVP